MDLNSFKKFQETSFNWVKNWHLPKDLIYKQLEQLPLQIAEEMDDSHTCAILLHSFPWKFRIYYSLEWFQ